MVLSTAFIGLLVALVPHNERAIFITQPLPRAFGAVPLPPTAPTLGGIPLDLTPGAVQNFARVLQGGRPPAGTPGAPAAGPAGVGGVPATPDAVTPPAPFTPGSGALPQLASAAPDGGLGGPFVPSPFSPGGGANPVGPTEAEPPVVEPTPTPEPTTSPTPTPTPTVSPTPEPTSSPTPTPTPTVSPTPEPTTSPTPEPTPTPTPPVIPAVPEPLTWLLMIGGFSGVGGVLRWRRRRDEFSVIPGGHR